MYVVKPSDNGGIVIEEAEGFRPERMPKIIGAFTTPADMITWLADQYGLQSHPTPKLANGGILSSQNLPLVGEKPSNGRLVPRETGDNADENGWIEWKGGERAPLTRGVPVYVRHRDGTEYPARVYEGAATRWTWKQIGSIWCLTDIVAYRPVAWKGRDIDPSFETISLVCN